MTDDRRLSTLQSAAALRGITVSEMQDGSYIVTPAEINAAMPRAWGDREISRFQFRAGLFARRGFAPERAEHLADRLALRDMQGDDRRVCMECEHLQADRPRHGRGCFAAQQGWLGAGVPKSINPLLDTLQRCERFVFQRP